MELIPLLHPRSSGRLVDVTWLVVPELNWAFAEGTIGIIAASLPSLRPLFIRLQSKIRGTSDTENDRSGVTLEEIPGGGRGGQARRHHQYWKHNREKTLQTKPGDEELGLCPGPGRSTQGSDKISTVSENPVSGGPPHPNNPGARSGHAEGNRVTSVRLAMIFGDFAVAH